MPTSVKHPKQPEMFYWKDRQRADADLHEPILEEGDHAKAESVSRKVAKRLGLSDEQIDALSGQTERVKRRIDFAKAKAQSAVLLARHQKYSEDEPRDEHGRWTDGGGDSGGSGDGGSGKFTSPSPEKFIDARNQSTRLQYMSPLKPQDLSGHTLITTKDNKAGVAIDPQGDLQNLFNNGGPKGIGADLVAEAIGKGARTLDCYAGHLPDYYHQFGFVETGRMKFNPEFAHGWDVTKHGQPDVVFMAWKGYLEGGEKGAIERAKSSKDNWIPNEQSRNYATDYDKAKEQSRVVAGRKSDHRLSGKESRTPADRAGDQSVARTGAGGGRPVALSTRWDESEHPRDEGGRFTDSGGGDGGGGGDKPPADKPAEKPVAGYQPGIKTPNNGQFHHSDAVKKDWIAKSPIKTMEDVLNLAYASQTKLTDVGRQIADKLKIELKDPGSKVKTGKGIARVIAKAKEPQYGSLAAVPDVARMTFLINHPSESDTILKELGKHFEVAGEPWRLTDVYYGDRAFNVRLPTGMMGEIQIMEPKMAEAKSPDGGGGHDWYVIARESKPGGVKPDPVKYAEANAKMREIYGKVLDQLGPDWKALFGKGGKLPKSA